MRRSRISLYAAVGGVIAALAVVVVTTQLSGADHPPTRRPAVSAMPDTEVQAATSVAQQEASFMSPPSVGSTGAGTWPSNVKSVQAISTSLGQAVLLLGTGTRPSFGSPHQHVILVRMIGSFLLAPGGKSVSASMISVIADPSTGEELGVFALRPGAPPAPALPEPTTIYQG